MKYPSNTLSQFNSKTPTIQFQDVIFQGDILDASHDTQRFIFNDHFLLSYTLTS